MSFLSFFNRTPQSVDLILDIGSGSVGAALVVSGAGKHPSTVFTVRKDIAFQKRIDPKRLPIMLADTLASVLDLVMKDGVKHLRFTNYGNSAITNVHVVLASPWYISHTKSVAVKKDNTFTVTKQLLSEYVQAEQHSLIDSLPEHEEQFQEGVRPIEHSVVRLLLNGYETASPIGKTAKEMCLSLYVSLMPESIGQVIETSILRLFHPQKIQFHTFGLVAMHATRQLFPTVEDFLFIDFGSEVSELFLVKKGVLTNTVSVPCGKHAFVRMVAHELSVDEAVALSTITLYVAGRAEPASNQRITDVSLRIKEEWLAHISVALDLLEKESTLPEKVYSVADPDIAPLIFEYCKSINSASAGKHWQPVVQDISVLNTASFVHHTTSAKSDIFLSLATLFVYQTIDTSLDTE